MARLITHTHPHPHRLKRTCQETYANKRGVKSKREHRHRYALVIVLNHNVFRQQLMAAIKHNQLSALSAALNPMTSVSTNVYFSACTLIMTLTSDFDWKISFPLRPIEKKGSASYILITLRHTCTDQSIK